MGGLKSIMLTAVSSVWQLYCRLWTNDYGPMTKTKMRKAHPNLVSASIQSRCRERGSGRRLTSSHPRWTRDARF